LGLLAHASRTKKERKKKTNGRATTRYPFKLKRYYFIIIN